MSLFWSGVWACSQPQVRHHKEPVQVEGKCGRPRGLLFLAVPCGLEVLRPSASWLLMLSAVGAREGPGSRRPGWSQKAEYGLQRQCAWLKCPAEGLPGRGQHVVGLNTQALIPHLITLTAAH